jgi:AraC-like DNA-binding protein
VDGPDLGRRLGPIEYLTRWRMLLAGRSLSRGEPIGATARSIGYESESAFSTAFKRVMGSTPAITRAWRPLGARAEAHRQRDLPREEIFRVSENVRRFLSPLIVISRPPKREPD